MKCNEVEIIISAQMDGEVTASEWREAEKHIATCRQCAETLDLFEQGTAYVKREAKKYEPSYNLWTGIAAQIEAQNKQAWHRRLLDRLNGFSDTFLFRPDPKIRYALSGFAAAMILFVGILFFRQIQTNDVPAEIAGSNPQQAMIETFAGMPKEQGQALFRRAALVQDLQSYFEQTGLLLMEIKNNEQSAIPNSMENIRLASKKLLDETIFIKKELQQPDMALVRQIIEQIETALVDLANMKDVSEKEDFELIKASILKKDLLIKIEIIDLKKLAKPNQETGMQRPESAKIQNVIL